MKQGPLLLGVLTLALVSCGSPAHTSALPGLSVPVQLSETNDPNSWTYGAQQVEFKTFGIPHDFDDRGAQLLGTVQTDSHGAGTLNLPGEAGLSGMGKQPASAALNAATEWFGCAAPQLSSSDPAAQVVVGAIGLVKFQNFDSPVWSANPNTRVYDLLIFATRATTLQGSLPASSHCHPDGDLKAAVQLNAGWNLLRYDGQTQTGHNAVSIISAAQLLPFQDD